MNEGKYANVYAQYYHNQRYHWSLSENRKIREYVPQLLVQCVCYCIGITYIMSYPRHRRQEKQMQLLQIDVQEEIRLFIGQDQYNITNGTSSRGRPAVALTTNNHYSRDTFTAHYSTNSTIQYAHLRYIEATIMFL